MVNVYVVVEAGDAIGFGQFVQLKPAAGVHWYVVGPAFGLDGLHPGIMHPATNVALPQFIVWLGPASAINGIKTISSICNQSTFRLSTFCNGYIHNSFQVEVGVKQTILWFQFWFPRLVS